MVEWWTQRRLEHRSWTSERRLGVDTCRVSPPPAHSSCLSISLTKSRTKSPRTQRQISGVPFVVVGARTCVKYLYAVR